MRSALRLIPVRSRGLASVRGSYGRAIPVAATAFEVFACNSGEGGLPL